MQINVNVPVKRLLDKPEAADYCGLRKSERSRFNAIVGVRPVQLPNKKDPVWDVRDLDRWIDGVKTGNLTSDDPVSKL